MVINNRRKSFTIIPEHQIKSMFDYGQNRSNSNSRRNEGSNLGLSRQGSKQLQFTKLFQYHAKKREESKISHLCKTTPKYIAKVISDSEAQQGTPKPHQNAVKYLFKKSTNNKLPNVLKTDHPKLSRLLSTSLNSKSQLALTKRAFIASKPIKESSEIFDKSPKRHKSNPYTRTLRSTQIGCSTSRYPAISSPTQTKSVVDPILGKRKTVQFHKYERMSSPVNQKLEPKYDSVKATVTPRQTKLMSRSKPLSPFSPITPHRHQKCKKLRPSIMTAYTQREP